MTRSAAVAPPSAQLAADATSLEFGILGPLQVTGGGQALALGGPRQRLVLVVLLLEANRLVTTERLIERVWGDEEPETARGTLQAYISRLRRVLGSGRLQSLPRGYRLDVRPDEVDALRFERLAAEARRRLEIDPRAASNQLDVALAMWRGAALADFQHEPALQADAAHLEELRVAAIEDRIEARLALGEHAEAVADLERLVAAHPFRERLWAALMLALYRGGRQGDALGVYLRAHQLLREELGIDPSSDLTTLQDQILRHDPQLDLRGRRLRGYELIEAIGEGDLGVVYRAYQPGVGRDVAIKVIHRRLVNEPAFVRRFEQEARLVARLEHPHIVPLLDFWREPDGAYLAMRYLRGGNLRDRHHEGPFQVDAALELLEEIGSALDAAHRHGAIHGDVCPSNILFDEDGHAYLSDFGIATDIARSRSLHGRTGGRGFYLAPEVLGGRAPSPAADLYSLGLVVYELLAGEHPLAGAASAAVAEGEPPAIPHLGLVRPDLPAAVSEVIERATATDPAGRFADAGSIVAAFRAALAGGALDPAGAPSEERNPYKGLRAFDEADVADFFGRDVLTAQLVERLAASGAGGRFLALVGPSGSGKSSVVRAGLVPALRRDALAGSAGWLITDMHPGSRPFEELEAALLRVAVVRPPGLLDELERDAAGLVRATGAVLPSDGSELVLIIDQLEELFTLVADDDRRSAFLDILVGAVTAPDSGVRVVVTLRADFYDRPLLHRGFGRELAAGTVALTPMEPGELERAIIGPAQRLGVSLEPGLLAVIMRDVADEPGALPLLQYALTDMFEHRDGATLTHAGYRRAGGVPGALASRAEQLYRRLHEAAREALRQLFLRLVRLGDEGSNDTRRRVLRSELRLSGIDHEAMDRAIDLFGAFRLLSFDRDPVTRGPTVEIAHEALLTSWTRLNRWIATSRDGLRLYHRLADDAAAWADGGRDPSFLLRGSRLEQLAAWSDTADVALSGVEGAFLDESRRQADEQDRAEADRQARETQLQRRSVRRLRAAVAFLAGGVLIAGSLGFVTLDRGRQAELQARIASAREVAAAANASLQVDSQRSLLLALEAAETTRREGGAVLPEAEEALHAAIQADRLLLTVPGYHARFNADGSRLLVDGIYTPALEAGEVGVKEAVVYDAATGDRVAGATLEAQEPTRVVFGPDERWFVHQSVERGLAVVTVADGAVQWSQPDVCCNDTWMDPLGRSMATLGSDGLTLVFDPSTGAEVNVLELRGPVAFAPDGVHSAAFTSAPLPEDDVSIVGYIGRLRAPGGGDLVRVRGHDRNVIEAAWSPDGSMLAAVSPGEGTIWDADTGELRVAFFPPDSAFASIAFDAASSRVATGMTDGTAIVWQLSGHQAAPVLHLAGHGMQVGSVAFHPSGDRLVTGGADGHAKVWDITLEGGHESLTVKGSHAIAWSPDGHLLASGGRGEATVHDARSGGAVAVLPAPGGDVVSLDFSGDGSMLAVALEQDSVSVWATATWTRLAAIPAAEVGPVAFGPTGSTLAVSGATAVRLVDGATGTDVGGTNTAASRQFVCCGGEEVDWSLNSLAFHPDGTWLMGAAWNNTWLWDMKGWMTRRLPQDEARVARFSPDGRRLYLGSSTGVTAWDAATYGQLGTGTRGLAQVTDLDVSPDGSLVATSSSDGLIRLWHADSLEPDRTVAWGAEDVGEPRSSRPEGQLQFSPDGSQLAFTSADGTVRIVTLEVDDLIDLARARLSRPLTDEECEIHLHLEACPDTVQAP